MPELEAQTLLDPIPVASQRAMGLGVTPEIVHAKIDFIDPELEDLTKRIFPFQIEAWLDDTKALQWMVLSDLSTVTDGTNGPAFDLTGLFDIQNAGDAYVYLVADVNTYLALSGWRVTNANEAKTEVFMPDTEHPEQTEARLFIGRVKKDDAGRVVIYQAITDAQRVVNSFVNGTMAKVFESAPVHTDIIT